jgi:hypothetical protein
MKHYLAFSILMIISLLMACCLTSAVQRLAPNLASQAQTSVATQAEGLGQNLVETMLPSLDVPSLEAQAQTMMASALPSLESQAQTLVATAMQGAGQQLEGTPQPAATNAGGQVPAGVPADFPVTQDATNLKVLGSGDKAQINYQTKMSLIEVVSFCTTKLTQAGWQIRPDLLNLTDTTVSLVFAKSSSPTDIVVQGVTTNGLTNVNVRYEVVK